MIDGEISRSLEDQQKWYQKLEMIFVKLSESIKFYEISFRFFADLHVGCLNCFKETREDRDEIHEDRVLNERVSQTR